MLPLVQQMEELQLQTLRHCKSRKVTYLNKIVQYRNITRRCVLGLEKGCGLDELCVCQQFLWFVYFGMNNNNNNDDKKSKWGNLKKKEYHVVRSASIFVSLANVL